MESQKDNLNNQLTGTEPGIANLENIASVENSDEETREEKSKKLLVLLMVMLIFGGTCYYYLGINKVKKIQAIAIEPQLQQEQAEENGAPSLDTEKASKRVSRVKLGKDAEIEAEMLKKEDKKEQKDKKIKPSGKNDLLGYAREDFSGKKDPFSYKESKYNPFEEAESIPSLPDSPSSSGGKMPNMPFPFPFPFDFKNLPGFPPGFGNINSNSLPSPPSSPVIPIVIKGFIGDKVIADIDGEVEALSKNERFKNVKVVAVNPSLLFAKFEVNGMVVTRSIRRLASEHSGKVQLSKEYSFKDLNSAVQINSHIKTNNLNNSNNNSGNPDNSKIKN